MATEKQIEANRKNAQKSTGPKTPEGKARSRVNAMKHGLLAERVITPEDVSDEGFSDFFLMYYELFEQYDPEGRIEEELVERIISLLWRLKRTLKIEQQILLDGIFKSSNPQTRLGEAFLRDANAGNGLAKLSRYEVMLERSLFRATSELERLQTKRMIAEADNVVALNVERSAG